MTTIRFDDPPSDRQARLQRALGKDYRVNFLIGSGGFAEVWSVEDLKLRREVAVKVLLPDLSASSDFVERFKREAQASARLRHPNILPIYAVGEGEGLAYFTMPRVKGDSLFALLQKEGRLTLGEAVRIACDAASALQEAHEAGLIHRDVKPENIMLEGGHRRVLLMDFGIAKSLHGDDVSRTQTGIVMGTPRYMSPEQAIGERTMDARSDLYSLGIVLFEMLTGQLPFEGQNAQELIAVRLLQPPRTIRAVDHTLPESVDVVVAKALVRDPATRWQTAEEFRDALLTASRTEAGGNKSGPPPTIPRQSWLTARRKVVAFVALLGAAGFGAVWTIAHSGQSRSDSPIVVAMMPLQALGPAEGGYFADGLADEIAQRLALTPGLAVVSRASAKAVYLGDSTRTMAEIARVLHADFVLTGSVRRDAMAADSGRVLVTTQLVRAADDIAVWTQSYERAVTAVFDVQRDIALQVVRRLGIMVTGSADAGSGRITGNLQAYDRYLRGLEYAQSYDEPALRSALDMFEQALTLDSTYALAYAQASITHGMMYRFLFDDRAVHLEYQSEQARRALELDAQLPEAHQAMAYYHYYGEGDLGAAQREFEIAKELQPSNSQALAGLGYIARRRGSFDTASAFLEAALQLDQFSEDLMLETAYTEEYRRDYGAAAALLHRLLDQSPFRPGAYGELADLLLLWNGDTDAAKATLLTGQARAGGRYPDRWAVVHLFEGEVGAALDSAKAARAMLDLPDYYLMMGDVLRIAGMESARLYYDSARGQYVQLLRDYPGEPDYLAGLGKALAGVGDLRRALEYAKAAVDSAPLSKDAFWGPLYVERLAETQMLGGEVEAAARTVETLLAGPSHRSEIWFRRHPHWKEVAPLVGPRTTS